MAGDIFTSYKHTRPVTGKPRFCGIGWVKTNVNNLKLNSTKRKEMIIRRPKTKLADLPLPRKGRFHEYSGRTLRFDLSFHEHVDGLVGKSAQTIMYALRLLRSQGLHGRYLWDVTGAVLVSRLAYASQAWWGLIDEGEKNLLDKAF